jgi:hypothetical protein
LWAAGRGLQTGAIDVPRLEEIVRFINPNNRDNFSKRDNVSIRIGTSSEEPIVKTEYFLNDTYVGAPEAALSDFVIDLGKTGAVTSGKNTLKVVVTDSQGKQSSAMIEIRVR